MTGPSLDAAKVALRLGVSYALLRDGVQDPARERRGCAPTRGGSSLACSRSPLCEAAPRLALGAGVARAVIFDGKLIGAIPAVKRAIA